MTNWVRKKTLDGVGDWLIVATFLCFLAGGVRWLMIDVRNYIDVGLIDVHDAHEGQRIEMEVARVLRADTLGRWRVDIRDGLTGTAVCSTGYLPIGAWWSYRRLSAESGELTALPDPLYLDWWAGGPCDAVLGGPDVPARLPAGLYSQETEHCIKPMWFLPQKCEAWPASSFRIYARG